jgi:hypothetical protein
MYNDNMGYSAYDESDCVISTAVKRVKVSSHKKTPSLNCIATSSIARRRSISPVSVFDGLHRRPERVKEEACVQGLDSERWKHRKVAKDDLFARGMRSGQMEACKDDLYLISRQKISTSI